MKKTSKLSQCANCGLSEWRGQPMKLKIHYKDGNRENLTKENVVLLCPNCYALATWEEYKNLPNE